MTDLPVPIHPTRRIGFWVINLPLERELRCGPFRLTPRENIEEVLKKLRRFGAEWDVTARGVFDLPLSAPEQGNEYAPFWKPAETICLLLTLANRCHIEFINPVIECLEDCEWRECGIHAYMVRNGNPRANPWYFGQSELEAFLERTYPRLLDEEFAKNKGMRLALKFLDESYMDDIVEMEYLKNWTAVEILYSHFDFGGSFSPVTKDIFSEIRFRLDRTLDDLAAEGVLKEEQLIFLKQRTSDLNRPGMQRMVRTFFNRVFEGYPTQVVTDDDAGTLLRIRNDITHSGVMKSRDKELAYEQELNYQQQRLHSLLIRTLLAMLGERTRIMDQDWRAWRFG